MKNPNGSFIIPKIMFFISHILIINPKEKLKRYVRISGYFR